MRNWLIGTAFFFAVSAQLWAKWSGGVDGGDVGAIGLNIHLIHMITDTLETGTGASAMLAAFFHIKLASDKSS